MKLQFLFFRTIVAGILKSLSSFISFIMIAAITRLMGAEESGLFLLSISILGVLSVFFRLGLDQIFLRLLGADDKNTDSINAITTGIIWAVFASVFFTIIIYINSEFISNVLLSKPKFYPILSKIIWALPFMVVFLLLSFSLFSSNLRKLSGYSTTSNGNLFFWGNC